MVTDKELLKEVTKELWHSVKKLRPGIPKESRMQLVLKALITIGDLPNQIEAAMVVATCLEQEMSSEEDVPNDVDKKSSSSADDKKVEGVQEGRRVVRRRSAAG